MKIQVLIYSALASFLLRASWAASCKNGGRLIDGHCKCLPGFTGEGCNSIEDFCKPVTANNAKCAPNACVTMYGGFWCRRCSDNTTRGIYCNRPSSDKTKLMSSPYTVFRPQMRYMEATTVLFSLGTLGDGFSLEVRWGDGGKDFCNQSHFRRGALPDLVPAIGVDALAPGSPGFNVMPKGQVKELDLKPVECEGYGTYPMVYCVQHIFRSDSDERYVVKLEHIYNGGDDMKTMLFIANNHPPGPSVDMKQSLIVYIAPAHHYTPTLSIPKCGVWDSLTPSWHRSRGMEIQGSSTWPSSGAKAGVQYFFQLITYCATPDQQRHPAYAAADKRFYMAPYTVPFGRHCVEFSAWKGRRMLQYVNGWFRVTSLPLAVVLAGGHELEVGPGRLELDASRSVDPNEPDNSLIRFNWICKCNTAGDDFCRTFHETGSRVVIEEGKLQPGNSYTFLVHAARHGLDPSTVKQRVTVQAAIRGHLAIVCMRNCGRGGAVLTTEKVWLRAVCQGQCPHSVSALGVNWEVDHLQLAPLDQENLVIGVDLMTTNTTYRVTLRGTGLGSSTLNLHTQGKLEARCAPTTETMVTCEARWEGQILETRNLVYELHQKIVPSPSMPGAFMLDFSYDGTLDISRLGTSNKAGVLVRVTHLSGAYDWVDLFVQIPTSPQSSLEEAIKIAKELFERGFCQAARATLFSHLYDAKEAVDRILLRKVAEMLEKYGSDELTVQDWQQEVSLLLLLMTKSVGTYGALLADHADILLRMTERASQKLAVFARSRDPASFINSADILTFSTMFMKVCNHMVLDPGSDTAQTGRNVTLSGSVMEPDYPLYEDLVPGFLDRVRRYRVAGRATLATLRHIAATLVWRLLPNDHKIVVSVERISLHIKIGSLEMLSQTPLGGDGQQPDFSNGSVRLNMKAVGPLKSRSLEYALTLIKMVGHVSWAEEDPPYLHANSLVTLMVQLHEYQEGPCVPAPAAPGFVYANLPVNQEFISRKTSEGKITAQTNMADWIDSIVVHTITVFKRTSLLKVNFMQDLSVGYNCSLRAVLLTTWPKIGDLYSATAVRIDSTAVLTLHSAGTKNLFAYLSVAPDKQSLEGLARLGIKQVTQGYSFTARNMACKRFLEHEYVWKGGIDREVSGESGDTVLTCAMAHLSMISGLVDDAPSFTHSIHDFVSFTSFRTWIVPIYVGLCWFTWVSFLYYMRRRDRKDAKWRVVVLEDVPPEASHAYMVAVCSGILRSTQSTAHIGIQLYGDEDNSGPHMLSHEIRRLSNSLVDWFILYTDKSLGELKSLELWSDCAGIHPYWYCEKVRVEEVSSGRTWIFPGFCWLSLANGMRQTSVVLFPEGLTFRKRYFMLFKAGIRSSHLWISIFQRHPRMIFSRAQRLTVVFTRHFLDMMSVMWFLRTSQKWDDDQTLWKYMALLFEDAILVGLQSALLLIIPNLVLVYLFSVREVFPVEDSEEASKITSGKRDEVGDASFEGTQPKGKKPVIIIKTSTSDTTGGSDTGYLKISSKENSVSQRSSNSKASRVKMTVSDVESGIPSTSRQLFSWIRFPASRTTPLKVDSEVYGMPGKVLVTPFHGYRRLNIKAHSRDLVIALGNSRRLPTSRTPCESQTELSSERFEEAVPVKIPENEVNVFESFPASLHIAPSLRWVAGLRQLFMKSDSLQSMSTVKAGTSDEVDQASTASGGRSHLGNEEYVKLSDNCETERRAKQGLTDRLQFNCSGRIWRLRRWDYYRVMFAWVVCLTCMLASTVYTILHGIKYTWFRSAKWICAVFISFTFTYVVMQPVKIALYSYILALLHRDPPLDQRCAPYYFPIMVPEGRSPRYYPNPRLYEKLSWEAAHRIQLLRSHQTRLIRCLWDTFLWLLWIVFFYFCVSASTDWHFFFLKQHLKDLVEKAEYTRTRRFGPFYDSLTYTEMYEYLNETLLTSLEQRKVHSTSHVESLEPYVAFAADNVTRLVTVMRLRQIRMRVEPTCIVAKPFRAGPPCYGDYNELESDRKSYDEGWAPLHDSELVDEKRAADVWIYRNSSQTDAFYTTGHEFVYASDGYVCDVGRVENNARLAISYLKNTKWMDRRSRVLIGAMTLYSPPTNLFCELYFTVERTAASTFAFKQRLYTYELSWASGRLKSVDLVLLMLLLVVSLLLVARELVAMVQERKSYSWNYFDAFLIILTLATTGTYITLNSTIEELLIQLENWDPTKYKSFEWGSTLYRAVTMGLSAILVMSAVRCWMILQIGTHFQVVKKMLHVAYQPILVLLAYLVILQLQFAIVFVLIAGPEKYSLHTVQRAVVLLLAYIVDYTRDFESFHILGWDNIMVLVVYWSFVCIMFFFFLNFFLGVISISFEVATADVLQNQGKLTMMSLFWAVCLRLPGAPPFDEKSIEHLQTEQEFISRRTRAHGDTLKVALGELDAINALYQNSRRKLKSRKELEEAMGVMTRMINQERQDSSIEATFLRVYTSDGEELAHPRKLDTVTKCLMLRTKTRGQCFQPEYLDASRINMLLGLLREEVPSDPPVRMRYRPPSRGRRATGHRVAMLSVRRDRGWHLRLRFLRDTTPDSDDD